jgi:hypothetical protein
MDENISCYLKTLQIREILIGLDPRICSYKLLTEGIYTLSKLYHSNKRAASLCKVFFVTFSYRLKVKLYDAASCTQRKFVFDLSEYELRHLEATFASSCKEFTSRPEEQTMDLKGGFSTNDI